MHDLVEPVRYFIFKEAVTSLYPILAVNELTTVTTPIAQSNAQI